jgi:hypothetical protein
MLFSGDDHLDSRMDHFQEGEYDESIPAIDTTPTTDGAIFICGAKLISDQMNANIDIHRPMIP